MATTTKKPASGTMQKNQSPAPQAKKTVPMKAQSTQKSPVAGTKAQSQRTQYSGSKKSAEFAKDMTKLDDVAIISDILTTEKNLVKLYGGALTEVSCEKLRKLVNSKMTECAKDQFDAFLYMNARNQYPTEPAPADKVCEAKQKFNCKFEQMKQ